MTEARAKELQSLLTAADEAEAGRAAVVGIRGAIGLGKSTLLDELRATLAVRGFTVLRTHGRAADAELGFASLLTLLQPVEGALDELAGDLAGELRSALALGRREAHPVDVRLATFRVLTALAADGPVLVAIDDAHLVDRATGDALAFAVGRLSADSVLTVFVGDDDEPTPFDAAATDVVRLQGLAGAELAMVVNPRFHLAAGPLERCVELADGNPLVALELAAALDPEQRAGRAPLPHLPRPSGVLARAMKERIDKLSEGARRALVVVAADDVGDVAVVIAALRGLGEQADDLAEAEAAGLVELDGHTVRFTHPLLRPVAYHQVGVASRRAAHRALAAALGGEGQGASRAWQLVAAAEQPDEAIAAALELVAGDEARRGGPASAARTLEAAAALTPDVGGRRDRLVAAVTRWLGAGDAEAASRTAATLAALPPTVDSVRVACQALRLTWNSADVLRFARAAVGTLPVEAQPAGEAVLATQLLHAGADNDAAFVPPTEPLAVEAMLEAGLAASVLELRPHQTLALGGDDLDFDISRARALLARGQLVAAADELERLDVIVPARAERMRAPLELALAEVELLLGRHHHAFVRASEVLADAEASGFGRLRARAAWLLGRLALAAGDHNAALPHLHSAYRGAHHLAAGDLIVAAAAVDRHAEVGAVEKAARLLVGHSAPATDIRARRALGEFDDALARADAAGLPFEAAEVLMARAEAAGRAGDAEGARIACVEAGDRLSVLGATGWNARLTAARGGHEPPEAALADRLSPAEHRVAVAVAEGRTNQEAAGTLFLSAKTVDFHLQNIYRKLGLRSRTELAVVVRGGRIAEVLA